MSLSETPARFNSDPIGTSRARRAATAWYGEPARARQTVLPTSPVTLNAPSVKTPPTTRLIRSAGGRAKWERRVRTPGGQAIVCWAAQS